ncbi:synaptotagmin-like protein 2 isoform X1 [Carassius auratus]|uniref:Synaptotagmin-like protein 2 n=1 Tax=Carassius auratus TaxID=7957 RepID=A0A6P6QYE9_CARAU|nr:synaptotagmin-like protein 2 isoform X1 [Carassius auratus]XP_026138284.1 synaptotagmin-like protein 2 isoform X1 [Carassius auratus]
MIDLSHLSEEEQEMIMTVLKRDAELKKAEEERIKHLQKAVPEEDKRKFMSGEWFYEAKSQRHQDRIHGSEIIMASMKQRKPSVVEYLTKSWGGRSRSISRKDSDVNMTSPKVTQTTESSEHLKERENCETLEVQQEKLNIGMRSPSKPRHNPFNSVPVELDFEETEIHFTSGPGLRKSLDRGSDSQVKHQEASHGVGNSEVFNTPHNKPPGQKPVPKKRTKINKPQSSVSDSTNSVSSQGVSTTAGSGVRSPPPRSIPKHSSNEPSLKSQLRQPVASLSYVRKNISQEKDLEESRLSLGSTEESGSKTENKEQISSPSPLKLPKSRLPVRASSQLINLPQSLQEKPKIKPRLSLNSITRGDDVKKVEEHVKQRRETHSCLPQTSNMELEGQKISGETNLPRENAMFTLTDNSAKPLDEITALQPTMHKSGNVENHMSLYPTSETIGTEENMKKTAVDQQFPRSLKITDTFNNTGASTDCETDSSPLVFNIKQNTNNSKQEDAKMETMTDEYISTPTDEPGDSIAKVLEWFSRSSDSSDRLDVESNVQDMEDDTKIDDIDFEDDIDQRAKPRDNVYLIIPRQSEEVPSEVNTIFLQQTDWGKEQNVEPSHNSPKEKRRYESASYKEPLIKKPSIDSAFTANNVPPEIPEVNISVSGKVSLNENKIKREEETKVKLEITDIKQTQNQSKEITGAEENQRPKIANLRSFWEKENIGPKILIGKSSVPAKNEHLIPSDNCGKPTEGVEEQQRSEQSLKVTSPRHQKQESVGEDVDVEHVGSGNTTYTPKVPIFTDESEPPLIYANEKTDQIHASFPLEKDVPYLKSSSPSLNSGSLLAGQNGDSRGTISINSNDADHTPPKELEAKSRTAPRTNQVPFVKQNSQQENMAERIKQLKSFWEKESRTSAAVQNKSTTTTRMNQRFTKSEFDLRTIGTDYDDYDADDVEDSTSARGRLSPNFSMHPLRKDKPNVMDGMSTSQFKNLRDFWGGSPAKSGQRSPVLESGNQRSLSPQSQNERASVKDFVNESHNNKTSSPAKTRVFQSPSKKRIMSRQESGSKTDQSHMISSLEATMVSKPQVGQESQPKHGRRNSKGSLNGKANAMRRAASMFSVNTAVEEQSQDLDLLSKKSQGPNLQQVKKAPEAIITQSRKTQEASYTLPKTSPEISWRDRDKNTQRRPSRTSEDSDSQPLARSFIPRDYQHYLGITEDRRMYTPPPVTEQVDDLICTSFTSSPETHRSCKCSPVKTSTPVQGSPDLQTRRGSLGCHSTTQTDGNATKGNLSRDSESPIQKALKRASSRPVFHKSMEDISTLPRQDQKQANDYMQSNYDDSSTLVQTSFATSDPVHLKQLSKSVPSFLQKESDGGESDSESSSRSGVPQWNNRKFTDFSNYSGSTSLSSVSGSVVSVYNSDYSSVDVQGSIQFSLNYVHKLREFHIFVVQCQNLAAVDTKRNRSDPYVKSYLIPDPANLGKRKTAVKKKTLNPTYNEILRYRVRMEYLTSQVLNLSAWHNDTFGRNSFLGEIELDLSSWDFNDTEWKLLPLKPRNLFSQTTNSLQPSDLRGQMRLAVRFLPQISQSKNTPGSGEVHIWVKDCKNLPLIRSPAIDPYVKCFVLPDTSKKSRQKTRVLKRTVNPVFNHTMVYDGFRAEDLKEACVELTVWDRDRLANHLLGGLRLGMGTGKSYGVQVDWMDSTAEEVALWRRMMESPNEWVEGMLPLRMVAAAKNTWK